MKTMRAAIEALLPCVRSHALDCHRDGLVNAAAAADRAIALAEETLKQEDPVELAAFAEDVLNYLEADDDWGPDTLEFAKGRAERYGLAGAGPDGLFIRKNHYRGREDDGWTYWAEAESGGWVVVRWYGGIGPAEPASDVLYADWASADAAAKEMAAKG